MLCFCQTAIQIIDEARINFSLVSCDFVCRPCVMVAIAIVCRWLPKTDNTISSQPTYIHRDRCVYSPNETDFSLSRPSDVALCVRWCEQIVSSLTVLYRQMSSSVCACETQKKNKIVHEQWTSFNIRIDSETLFILFRCWCRCCFSSLACPFVRVRHAYIVRKTFDCVRLSTPKSIYQTMTESFALHRPNYIGRKNVRRILPFLFLRRVFLSRQFWLLRRGFWFSARKQRQRTARTTRNETERFFRDVKWDRCFCCQQMTQSTLTGVWGMLLVFQASITDQRPIQYEPHKI